MAGGAATTVLGMRQELETLLKQRVERALARMDLVTREEFDAVRDMAVKARMEQDRLEKRLRALERPSGARHTAGRGRGKAGTAKTGK